MKISSQQQAQIQPSLDLQKNILKKNDFSKIPEPYVDVAKKMETEFAKMMIDKMKSSMGKTENADSAQDFYDSLMTQEQAETLTKREGLGVAQMILDQIYPVSKRTDQNMQAYLQSAGLKKGGGHHE